MWKENDAEELGEDTRTFTFRLNLIFFLNTFEIYYIQNGRR